VLNCNEAIRLNPNLVRAYLYRGCLKYSIRLYDHAINDLTKALEIDPSCAHAYYNRALCHIRRRNLSHAFKDFAIVLCLASTVTDSNRQLLELETYVNRGLLHYEHKDFQNALVDFEHALELVLKSGDEKKINAMKHKLIYTIGQCHHRLAQFDRAIEQFTSYELDDRAMMDISYRHDLWVAQGNVYMDMNNEKSKLLATKFYEHVLHENPMHEQARLNLGYCLRQRGYFQRAWIQFSALLHFNPSNVRALEARAIVCLQMNHPTEAFIDLNQALRFEPSSAQLLTNRGVIQQYLGDNRNAMCDYRAAMLADPQNAFAHYNAGNILMFHGQFIEAITLFNRVIEINPRDEAALTNRAIAKVVLKQYTSAREDLEHALRISPLSAHIHVDLGQLLLTMDEPIEAEKHFSRALEIRPCDPVVYKWRGDARSKQDGKRQEALDDYRTCVELNDALQLARKHGLIKAPTRTRRRL
jgi:tetratricopeptide (TPR) repeat protein